MTLGRAPEQGELGPSSATYCDGLLSPTSIYGLLYRECHELFPDDAFADLFADIGRSSVPPRIVAVVMVLQRLEGLSDREAVERFSFDVRWKYAAGGLPRRTRIGSSAPCWMWRRRRARWGGGGSWTRRRCTTRSRRRTR